MRKYTIDKEKQKIKRREYYLKTRQQSKEYYEKNKKRIADRVKKRYNTDIVFKLIQNTRRRINKVLYKNKKNKKTKQLLGCDGDFLKQYLETKFVDGMSWDNYGKWEIDHIIPISIIYQYKYGTEQFWKLFECVCHYTNLQPLWQIDNIRKSNKLE